MVELELIEPRRRKGPQEQHCISSIARFGSREILKVMFQNLILNSMSFYFIILKDFIKFMWVTLVNNII